MTTGTSLSLAAEWSLLPISEQEVFLMGLTREEMAALRWDWTFWARPEQMSPIGDWNVWLALAGRGFGKTRLGSEWVRDLVCGPTPLAPGHASVLALVGETAADVRDVMVLGAQQGILATHPPDYRPRYVKTGRGHLEWPNGAKAYLYSAEEPDQLRGPEHDAAWSDELAKWRYAQDAWDMLQFGLRVGSRPRQLVTTTPRPIPIVKELLRREAPDDVVITRGNTYDNQANLAPSFLKTIRDRYEGTRLGRQELHAELLDDVPGAMWTRAMLDRRSPSAPLAAGMWPGEPLPAMQRVAVGVDPSGSSGEEDGSDDVGIVAAGLGIDGLYYVLDDATCALGPSGWGRRVVDTYNLHYGDVVVAEVNYGGAMVEHTIRTVSRRIPYRSVRASRGKVVRAAPIASLYEQGLVRHVATFAQLEDQMCAMTKRGYEGDRSPDRVDALVWALTELDVRGEPPEAESGTFSNG